MRALVFDTETTGLVENMTVNKNRQPEVIDFYGCLADLDTGEIERDLDLLIKPVLIDKLPDKIVRITRITDDMLVDCPTFKVVAPLVADLFSRAECVVAHNATFDVEMIEIEMARAGIEMEMPPAICTVEQTVHLFGGKRIKLGDLHQHLLGRPLQEAHRAKSDVLGLLACAVEMRKREMI